MLGTYLARLGLTVAGGLARGEAGLLEPLRWPFHVWPTDIDVFGHMNNGRYLTLMDQGRFDHSIRTGLLREAFKRRWKPVIGATAMRYRRELKAFQACELVTRLSFWDEKWFYFEQGFERGGEVCAVGFAKGVIKKQRSTIAPAEAFAAVGHRGPVPTPSDALRRWIDAQ